MGIIKGSGDFFALDIGTNAVRVVQLSPGLTGNSWNLDHYGYASIDDKTLKVDTVEGQRRLGEAIMTAVGQSGIKTKDVVIGLSSSKTFTTVIDMPFMPEAELRNTIKYQIDQYIPMPLNESKYDFAILGKSLRDEKQIEVLVSSVANTYTEDKMEFIESLGFNVLASEPEGLAILRSLIPDGITDARLTIDIGEVSTDLAITYQDTPRLVRSIPTGIRSFVKSAVQNLNVQETQARQFILKFGLASDKLEGHVFHAIESSLDSFATELTKSIKFFQTRYPSITVNGIILSGYAAVIPQLPEYITAKTGLACSAGNPWQGINVTAETKSKLSQVSSEFAAVIGLAKRFEK
jgi:type IV pilus assembly protein PilM